MTGQRAATAAVLIALVAPTVMWPGRLWPALLFGAFCLTAAVEWARLCGLSRRGRLGYALGALALLGLSWWLLVAGRFGWLAWPAAAGWLAGVPWWLRHRPVRGRLLLGWAVILPGWGSLLYLHGMGPALLAYLLVLVALMDSVAYFAGRRWGRWRLAPALSPGKTWEGLAGGLLAAVAVSGGWWWAGGLPAGLALLGLCAGAAGVLGDLLESAVKRDAGVKDSGGLLVGHGGVLDRIDSLCAAAPIYAGAVLLYGLVI